jgi:hypothetical protein
MPRLAASHRRFLQIALVVCACVAGGVAVWDVFAGGFYFRVLGIRLSSWDASKPFRIAIVATVLALWLHDHEAEPSRASWNRLTRVAPWMAAAVTITCIIVAVHFRILSAGGADSYGYVSQAHLWASGQLIVRDPLAPLTPALGDVVVPLGYERAREPGYLAPIYSPGLPMLMALAIRLAGPSAVYVVVPLLAGLTVWLTYALARRTADDRTAFMASTLLAFSPMFLFQSLEPMSDVPVTTCWIAAWLLAASGGAWTALGAGLAVSAAVLTRPNLVPLSIVVAAAIVLYGVSGQRLRRVALFAAGVLPGCLLVAWLNNRLHGSPLRSGYGPLEGLYAWNRFWPNLVRYTTWLVQLHTPAILIGLAAPFIARVKGASLMVAFTIALLFAYLFYFVFDSWPFTRFLLPGLPLLFILGSSVALWIISRAPLAYRGGLVFLICLLLPCWYLIQAHSLGAFAIQRAEHRYDVVGRAVGESLEPQAIVFTLLESGSVRLYGDRPTLRWDEIEPANLSPVIALVRAHGYVPYVLLEQWEEPQFRERFERASEFGRLDWPPILRYDGASTTRIYALDDRVRYLSGTRIITRAIGAELRPE